MNILQKSKELFQNKDSIKDNTKFFKQTEDEDHAAIFWGKWDVNSSKSKKPQLVKFVRSDEAKSRSAFGRKGNGYKNPEEDEDKIKEIIFGNQFKLILYNDGTLYSWGISPKGCLGLGDNIKQTKNRLEKIDIEDVVQVKIGLNHVLALTKKGEVYAWGDNSKGQIGVSKSLRSNIKRNTESKISVVYAPKKVYPLSRDKKKKHKKGIQIVAYNNTSFILTSGSSLVSKAHIYSDDSVSDEEAK